MEPQSNFERYLDKTFLNFNTLSEANALEYFYGCRFFDPDSLNQLRRKGQNVPEDMAGLDFRVVYVNDAGKGLASQGGPLGQWNIANQFGVFVIQKSRRSDKASVETPLECYYILAGSVYKAPSFGGVIRYRMVNATTELEKSFDKVCALSQWSLTNGFSWNKSAEDEDDDEETDDEEEGEDDNDEEMGVEGEGGESAASRKRRLEEDTEVDMEVGRRSKRREDEEEEERGSEDRDSDGVSPGLRSKILFQKRPCPNVERALEDVYTAFVKDFDSYSKWVEATRGQLVQEETSAEMEWGEWVQDSTRIREALLGGGAAFFSKVEPPEPSN